MRRLLLGLAFTLPVVIAAPASALPSGPGNPLIRTTVIAADVIEVKGGHGWGGGGWGHGWGRGYAFAPPGWSRGRKVGWRGRGCPPGLWKQGRC